MYQGLIERISLEFLELQYFALLNGILVRVFAVWFSWIEPS